VGRVRPPAGGRAGLDPWCRLEALIGEKMDHRMDEKPTKRPLAAGTGVGGTSWGHEP
jgi:hypothetical protein